MRSEPALFLCEISVRDFTSFFGLSLSLSLSFVIGLLMMRSPPVSGMLVGEGPLVEPVG